MEEIISPKDEVRGGDMEKGAHGKGCVHGGSQPRPEVWYKCKEGVGKKHSNPTVRPIWKPGDKGT